MIRIRPYNPKTDFKALVELQTTSFHEKPALALLNGISYSNFRAEVLDGVRKKERYSDPESFQILVAEEVTAELGGTTTPPAVHARDLGGPGRKVTQLELPVGWEEAECIGPMVAAVEITIMDEGEVLAWLPRGTQQYNYISSMAVAHALRRRGVAHTLLQAAEEQARQWLQPNMALHVYADNAPAVALYQASGYDIIHTDPAWRKMIGNRIRLLMYKTV